MFEKKGWLQIIPATNDLNKTQKVLSLRTFLTNFLIGRLLIKTSKKLSKINY